MTRTIAAWLAALLLMLSAAIAGAVDVVVLKDGRRVEGEIIREIDGNIWMMVHIGTIRKQEFFASTTIEEILRDAVEAAPAPEQARRRGAARPGAIKGTVITLEGMVGVEMAAHKLEELIPILEQEIGEGGVLVLKINSGGGFLAEIKLLSDVIENKLKPKFEVVGWIESAISAAAMTGITLERLYFLPEGNIGAATGWYGALTAVKGRDLEEVLYGMEFISARGKRDPKIMRSMQIDEPLSATINPQTGEVTWYQDEDSGEVLVNPKGEILTLNSVMAEKLRFSEGIARDLDELTRKMEYGEIEWVGQWQPDLIFPVGRAERENRRWREFIDQNNAGMQVAYAKYQLYLTTAQGQQDQNRAKLVGRARQFLRQVKRYHDASPKLITVALGLNWDLFDVWYEEQEEILRRLME
jgi:membrane-bound ClpP family serine protease